MFSPGRSAALSRQIAVEQNFVVELMGVDRHAQGLIGALDRRQDEACAPGAENDRRDHHVQAVEAAGGEKPRNGIGAAFNQHAAHAAIGQRGENCGAERFACRRLATPESRPRPAARTVFLPPSPAGGERHRWQKPWRSAASRPFGSSTTRAGCGPATRRTVSCGSSASAVPTPMTTASTSARSRCKWARPAGPLMYFEWPDSVAMRPSSDWPIWPTTTMSSDAPVRSGPNSSPQGGGRGPDDRLKFSVNSAQESRLAVIGKRLSLADTPVLRCLAARRIETFDGHRTYV